jgi:uncharacterized membrane protein YfcA
MNNTVLIIAVGAIIAGFVQGLSGFAFSLVATSIWAWGVNPKLAAACAIFGGLSGQIMSAFTMRRGFDFKLLAPYLIGAAVGIPLGISLVPLLDVSMFKVILGGILVIWCPLMLFANRLPRITGGGSVADGAAGFLGGVGGGIGGFTGVVPTLWCTMRGMQKDTQRAIIQNFNMAALAFTFIASIVKGNVTQDMVPMFGIVLVCMAIPVLLGGKVYIGISDVSFRRIVLTLLAASGVALLASGLPPLLARL